MRTLAVKLVVKGISCITIISLVLMLAITFLLATKTGSSLLISSITPYIEQAVPNLSLSPVDSQNENSSEPQALMNGLSLPQFVWQNDSVIITGSELNIQFEFFCAATIIICIEQLTLNTLDITLPSNTDTPASATPQQNKAITLPDLSTPYPIYIKELAFNNISINPSQEKTYLQNITWQANNLLLRKSKLSVDHSVFYNDFFKHTLNGKMTLSDGYAVSIQQHIRLNATEKTKYLEANVELSGTIAQLQLDIATLKPESVQLSASLQALHPLLPGKIDFYAANINPVKWVSNEVAFEAADLSLSMIGDISNFSINANTKVVEKNNDRIIPIQFTGAVKDDQLYIESLRVGQASNRLLAQGGINWREAIQGQLNIEFDRFNPPTIGGVTASDINGSAEVKFTSQNNLSSGGLPSYNIDSNFRDIQFMLMERAYSLSGSAAYNSDQITLSNFQFGTPANSATIDAKLMAFNQTQFASIDNTLDWLNRSTIQANINAKKLSQFHPKLSGQLVANINSSKNQLMTLAASAQAFKLGNDSIKDLTLAIDIPSVNLANSKRNKPQGSHGKIDLALENIDGWGMSFDNIKLVVAGDISEHTITLNANSTKININSELRSGFLDGLNQWQARLITLDGNYRNNNSINRFSLSKAIDFSRHNKNGLLNISDACIAIDQGYLCAEANEIANNKFEIPFLLKGVSLSSLNTVIPQTLRLEGELFGAGSVKNTGTSGLIVRTQLNSTAGSIKNQTTEIPITLAFEDFKLDLHMAKESFTVNAGFISNDSSNADMTLSLSGAKLGNIDARANFLDFPVDVFAPFIPQVHALKGQLSIELIASGSVTKPRLNGSASLSEGSFQLTQSTSTIRDITIESEFLGSAINLDGAFTIGDGIGHLSGNLDFANALAGKLQLTGQQLHIESAPELDLYINTDMTLHISDNVIFASGNLSLPEGKINLIKLPVNATSLSKDVTFVQDERQQVQTFQLKTDLNIGVGPNLSFTGFEASGDLKGSLQIKNDIDEPFIANGEIDFTNSKYRGYGQKLDVRRGRLLFLGPIDDPKIDLEAIRQVADTTVGLKAYGDAKKPQISPFSEPPLPDNDIIYMLITGNKVGQKTTRSQDQMIAYALLASSVKVGEKSISETAEKIGVSDFNIGSSDDSDLLLSGYLNPALYLEYGVNVLGDTNAFKLRWDFAKRFSLEFISGIQSSMDVIYAREF